MNILAFVKQCITDRLFTHRFSRNLGYMGFAQIANRAFRLAASITVARLLFPEDYGIAALALTVNELVHVLIRGAVLNKLVQCEEHQLKSLCESAYWLNWLLCLVLMLLQTVIAIGFAWWHGNIELGIAIAVLSLTYLVLPSATIHAALTLRDNRLGVTATSETLQTLVDSLFTILLAVGGFGFWALVLPKLIAAPVWAIVYRKAHQWKPQRGFNTRGWSELLGFGKHIIAGDAVLTLRNHIDYLLIASFLDMKALGLYFFAYNAGLGISQGFINAYTTTLYPHLCEAENTQQRLQRYRKAMLTIACVAIPVILLQSCLAPLYIPIIFGERWAEAGAVPLVIIICLSAIARPFAESASQLIRANGQPRIDFIWQCLFTIALMFGLTIGLQWGLYGIALATLITHLVLQPLYAYWAMSYTAAKPSNPWRISSCQHP